MRTKKEVAQILDLSWDKVEFIGLNSWQIRTLRAIRDCRTVALGGHVDACDSCGHIQISYNSCRNRHCPKCQGHKRDQWIAARSSELLPVPYFHVVFTLPQELNTFALHKPKLIYDALFKAAWATIAAFAGKRNKSGMIAILHTWGQNLSLHPHLHCIVPGGMVTSKGEWQLTKSKGKFLFPVKAMSRVFRAKYMSILRQTERISPVLSKALFSKEWVVYAKQPFGSPKSVVEYLGRYTHKVAISNHRILAIDDQRVTISYKDYRVAGQKKTMTLSHGEFIRRFALHILPKRLVRIRHFGILSSKWKPNKLPKLQSFLTNLPLDKTSEKQKKSKPAFVPKCPCCKSGTMIIVMTFGTRGPPDYLKTGWVTSNTNAIV